MGKLLIFWTYLLVSLSVFKTAPVSRGKEKTSQGQKMSLNMSEDISNNKTSKQDSVEVSHKTVSIEKESVGTSKVQKGMHKSVVTVIKKTSQRQEKKSKVDTKGQAVVGRNDFNITQSSQIKELEKNKKIKATICVEGEKSSQRKSKKIICPLHGSLEEEKRPKIVKDPPKVEFIGSLKNSSWAASVMNKKTDVSTQYSQKTRQELAKIIQSSLKKTKETGVAGKTEYEDGGESTHTQNSSFSCKSHFTGDSGVNHRNVSKDHTGSSSVSKDYRHQLGQKQQLHNTRIDFHSQLENIRKDGYHYTSQREKTRELVNEVLEQLKHLTKKST